MVLGAANVVLETLPLAVPEAVRCQRNTDEDADEQRDEDRGERGDVVAEIEHGRLKLRGSLAQGM